MAKVHSSLALLHSQAGKLTWLTVRELFQLTTAFFSAGDAACDCLTELAFNDAEV